MGRLATHPAQREVNERETKTQMIKKKQYQNLQKSLIVKQLTHYKKDVYGKCYQ